LGATDVEHASLRNIVDIRVGRSIEKTLLEYVVMSEYKDLDHVSANGTNFLLSSGEKIFCLESQRYWNRCQAPTTHIGSYISDCYHVA
jgi:hypothetical protein